MVGRGEVGITGYQYKKLKQQTFENNSDMSRTNLNPLIGVSRLPSIKINES